MIDLAACICCTKMVYIVKGYDSLSVLYTVYTPKLTGSPRNAAPNAIEHEKSHFHMSSGYVESKSNFIFLSS